MNKIFLKAMICLAAIGFVLYYQVNEQNKITAFKIALPAAMKELKNLKEETMHLRYQIEQFASPENLLALAKKSEFSHLRYPLSKELIAMNEGVVPQETGKKIDRKTATPSIVFAFLPRS